MVFKFTQEKYDDDTMVQDENLLDSEYEREPTHKTPETSDESVDLPDDVRKTLKLSAEIQNALQDEVLTNIVQQFWNNDLLSSRKTSAFVVQAKRGKTLTGKSSTDREAMSSNE